MSFYSRAGYPLKYFLIDLIACVFVVAVAEDEAAFEAPGQTVMEVPTDLAPAVRELIAKRRTA